MKIKKVLILLLIILLVSLFTKTTYAANEVEVLLKTSKTTLNVGDKVEIEVSIVNNSSENDIKSLVGYIEFDADVFELANIDIDELDEEQQMVLEQLMEEEGTILDILSFTNNWIIVGIEDEEDPEKYIIYATELSENGDAGVGQGQTSKIGEIKFNVLDSAKEGTSSIKMNEMAANEEMLVAETTTSEITILGGSSSGENESEEQEQTEEEEEEQTEEEQEQQEANEAKQDLVYTGAEDVIPYVFILIITMVISYVKWKKYKDI